VLPRPAIVGEIGFMPGIIYKRVSCEIKIGLNGSMVFTRTPKDDRSNSDNSTLQKSSSTEKFLNYKYLSRLEYSNGTHHNDDTIIDLQFGIQNDTIQIFSPGTFNAFNKYLLINNDSLTIFHLSGDTLRINSMKTTLQGKYKRQM
jgi:hypothetical protein